MKSIKEYINEAQAGFDASWFGSKECVKMFNDAHDNFTHDENELFLWVTNTQEIYKQYDALMKSAIKHKDFDVVHCATSSTMNKIILAGVKEHNKAFSDAKIGRLSAESKKRVGIALVCWWEPY